MIALDTNILVYATRREHYLFELGRKLIEDLANGNRVWTVPSACEMEFITVVSNARLFERPADPVEAIELVERLSSSEMFTPIREGERWLSTLKSLLPEEQLLRGPRLYDLRIAAQCLDNGVTELWTVDRDFNWLPQLPSRNPFV